MQHDYQILVQKLKYSNLDFGIFGADFIGINDFFCGLYKPKAYQTSTEYTYMK